MHFVFIGRDREDGLETRLANRPAHLEFLKRNGGRVRAGGPLLGADGEKLVGSVLLIEAESEAEVRALLAQDPYATAGLFASTELLPFRWSVNPPTGAA